jgi:hypothetical protein
MKVLAENFKGIEFIRISKLPEEQKKQITQSLPSDHIIKILRENELLVDCVQFKHYEQWFTNHFDKQPKANGVVNPSESKVLKVSVD